jgi:hypothetical protein
MVDAINQLLLRQQGNLPSRTDHLDDAEQERFAVRLGTWPVRAMSD